MGSREPERGSDPAADLVEVSEKAVPFEDSLDASKARLSELLEAINLETPKEVSS